MNIQLSLCSSSVVKKESPNMGTKTSMGNTFPPSNGTSEKRIPKHGDENLHNKNTELG